MTGEQEVERRAQPVDVRSDVDRVTVRDLLRGDVIGRAEHDLVVVLDSELVGVVVQEPGQTHVQEARHALAIDEDVPRLDVAVNELVAEGVFETVGDLPDVADRAAEVHRAELLHHVEQVRPVHVVHDDEVQVPVLVDVVRANDVRVIQPAGGAGLAVEPAERGRLFRLRRRQHLHRDAALHEHVFAQEHLPHPADADALQQFELADGEPAPLAQEELFGLEVGEDAVLHEVVGELAWIGGHPAAHLPPLEVSGELRLVHHAALADQLEQFFDRGGCGHRSPCRVRGGISAQH